MSEKNKFGAVVILAIVFAIGGLFGVGGTIYYIKQSHGDRRDRISRSERTNRDIYRVQVDRMTARLEKSLKLSEEQVPLIRAEIQKFGNAMQEVHESMQPQFRALMEERSIAIERHLTEEQLAAFREDRKRHRERARSHHDGKKSVEGADAPSSSGPRACLSKPRSRTTT